MKKELPPDLAAAKKRIEQEYGYKLVLNRQWVAKTIKVDKSAFDSLKAAAKELDYPLQEALSEALELWVDEKKRARSKSNE